MDISKSMFDHFSVIQDPRIDRHKKHQLIDIIVLSVCGITCGCDSFVDIENYGKSKIDWFKTFLGLPNGIPSHDTIGRVFSIIDPIELQKAFYEWSQQFIKLEGETINIDGKYICSSHGAADHKRSIFGMVNAYASEAGVALAQIRTDFEKKNEKDAFKEMVDFLNVKGALVTLDANGCYAKITNRIVEKGGDFLVGLKKNQRSLYRNVEEYFNMKKESDFSIMETLDKGHGRAEKRKCCAVNLDDKFLSWLKKKCAGRHQEQWERLKSVCRITCERTVKGKTSVEERYYISSVEADANRMLLGARSHWGIENKLHWSLDVGFNEDSCRVRSGYAGENFAVIRQLSLNLLKQESTRKKSIKSKRLICGWENDYLKQVVMGMSEENVITDIKSVKK